MNLAVLGLARNCALQLERTLNDIESWGLSTRVIIGEDGSADATREIISRRAQLVDTTPESPGLARLTRMAHAREKVKEAYEAGPRADLVIVLDMDGEFAGGISADWIRRAHRRLQSDPTLAGITAHSNPYYDLLAYEGDPEYDFSRLQEEIDRAKRRPISYYKFKRENVYPAQIDLGQRGSARVISAFNGVAVYLSAKFSRGTYLSAMSADVCEHVTMNRQLTADGSRILIDTTLRVVPPYEHLPQSPIQFYSRMVSRSLVALIRDRGK